MKVDSVDEAGNSKGPLSRMRTRPDIRLMQVAVDTVYQGEGIGRELVAYAEKRAKEAGYKKIIMHAMLFVVGFYEKLGYAAEGEPFDEQGITFMKMVKKL